MVAATEIPKAVTPPGGWRGEMPPPVLAACTEPIADGLPDLRGLWRAVGATDATGSPLPEDHAVRNHVERIEQAGIRVVITAAGIIHDMYADGTYEGGVNDVAAIDFTTPITVAAAFEGGTLVLRPEGLPGVEIRRWLEGEQLIWSYHVAFTATMERVS
jgi:hypothetical protein